MPSQIFQNPVLKSMLFNFLDKFADRRNNQYVFSKSAFKRAQLSEAIHPFCESLKSSYYPSKYFYLTRKMNYKNFVTIVRQICKYHNIAFTSTIKYSKSKYEIVYSIFVALSD